MAHKIALFNHKGGVSKTTTTFHLGWMLASKNLFTISSGLALRRREPPFAGWY